MFLKTKIDTSFTFFEEHLLLSVNEQIIDLDIKKCL